MGRRRKAVALLVALALCGPLTARPAAAAGGFTIVMGGANPLHALGDYNLGTYVVADLDGDSDLDVAVREPLADTTIDVLRNDGGSFTLLTGGASPFAGITFPAHSLNFLNSRVLTGDFDADGDVDLWHHAVTFAAFYRNDGGTFSAHVGAGDPLHELAVRDPGSYVVIDVDGDHDPDVIARDPDADASVELLRNVAGTFVVDPGPFASVAFPSSPANFLNTNLLVLDADRDGDDDLWHHGVGFAALYRNDGASFSTQAGPTDPLAVLEAADPGTYMTGDVDSDGDVDVIVREPTTDLSIDVLRSDAGGFAVLSGAASPFVATPLGSSDFAKSRTLVGDFDSDGDVDVYNHVLNELYAQAGNAPRLVARTPAPGDTDVPVTTALTLTFDEPVTLGAGSIVLRRAGSGALIDDLHTVADAARFSGQGSTTITVAPAAPLPFASSITVEVEPGALASSTDGDAFAGVAPTGWRFTTAANTPPGLAGLDGDAVVYTEGDAPVVLDTVGAATVTDTDGVGFGGGELTVTLHGALPGEDLLVSAPATDLGAVTDTGTSIHVALGAGATESALSTHLRSVAYVNRSEDDPTPGTRTATVSVTDGDGLTAGVTVQITVVAVNDPPTLNVPGGYAVTSGSTLVVDDVTIGDVDDDTLSLTASADVGTFEAGRSSVTTTGSIAALDAAIAAGAFAWHAPLVSARGSIEIVLDDGDARTTARLTVEVNDTGPPVVREDGSPNLPTPGPIVLLTPAPWEQPITAAAKRSFVEATGAGPVGGRAAAPVDGHGSDPSGELGTARRLGGAPPDGSPRTVALGVWFALVVLLIGGALLVVHGRRDRDGRTPARRS